jgi:ABC transporter substrate binding protein
MGSILGALAEALGLGWIFQSHDDRPSYRKPHRLMRAAGTLGWVALVASLLWWSDRGPARSRLRLGTDDPGDLPERRGQSRPVGPGGTALAAKKLDLIAALTHVTAYAAPRATSSTPIVSGLAAYSADYDAMVRRAACYVDRILNGARPADLPVAQPTRCEVLINLKVADALGLAISPSLLARADQVIQ